MSRKVGYLVLICVMFLFLFGCKQGEVTTPIYVSDLDRIQDEFKFTAETTLKFPVPSKKWINDRNNRNKVTNLLDKYFNNYEGSLDVVSTGMSTMVETTVNVPIYNYNKIKKGKDPDYPLLSYGVFHDMKGDDGIVIILNHYDKFKNDFDSTFMMADFDIQDFDITINLRNDNRDKFKYTIGSCYIDNTAVPYKTEIELEGRNDHTIVMSKVYTYGIPYFSGKDNNLPILTF